MKEKVHELRDDELQQKLESLKTELFNLRFSHATGQLSNPLQIQKRKTRHRARKNGYQRA